MAQPTAYERQTDFTERDADDTNHSAINDEFDAAALTIGQIRTNLALIQKDDGSLVNGIVTADSLDATAYDALLVVANTAVDDAQTASAQATLAATTANTARDDAQTAQGLAEIASTASQLNAAAAAASAVAAAASADDAAASAVDAAQYGVATAVGFTPVGTIAATNVQTAIAEVVSDLSASSGTSLVGFLPAGTGAAATTTQAKLREIISVKDFGATGDGTTNDSTAIQAAIDHVYGLGGGVVYFPQGNYRCNLTLKTGVTLTSFGTGTYGYLPGATYPVKLTQAAAGFVVDTGASAVSNCAVVGLTFSGLGAGTAGGGVNFQNVSWGAVKQCSFNGFADQAILKTAGLANTFEDILTTNCLLNRTRAAVSGCVEIAGGTDDFLSRIEASASLSTNVTDANLRVCGLALGGSNLFVSNCIGEFADQGIYVSATNSRFLGCRADLNFGHGWRVTGTGSSFSACQALNNSQDTTNTYDNWLIDGWNNTMSGCQAIATIAKVPRYGFNDQAPTSEANKNYHTAPYATGGHGTASYNFTTGESSAWTFPQGSPRTLTANSATPSVAGYEYFKTGNGSTTTITDFTGGVNGQRITIVCFDSNTTIQHNGATIVTPNGGNVKLRSGVHYELIRAGVWRLGPCDPAALDNVGADVGNAAKTLQNRVSEPTQQWNTPLTVDRAVTLSTTGAVAGAKFRIVRTAAATGAFNLNVGTGPLKALTAGQWCDVEYNGSAWMLTAFGSL